MHGHRKRETRSVLPIFFMGCLFVLVHGLALLATRPFEVTNIVAFENPNDPTNLAIFFLTLLLFTVVILLIAKFWNKRLIQAIILGATGYLSFFVLYPLLSFVVPEGWSLGLSISAVGVLIISLVKYPEWYVIDVCGVIVGVGAVAMLGISLNIFLTIALLILLAAYDAISVYKTKHMIDLADTVLSLRLPVILVVPKVREYSLLKEPESLKRKLEETKERDAFFMGLGDVVMPGILVASTFHNVVSNGFLIACAVILGTLFGFVLLMTLVVKGKPQAGLPYLCCGAILGYLVSSYALFGELVGLTLP